MAANFIQKQVDKVLDLYTKVWVQEVTAGFFLALSIGLFFLPLADPIIQQTPDDEIRIRASVHEGGGFELQGSSGEGWEIKDHKDWGDTIFIETGAEVRFMIFAMDMTHAFQITNGPGIPGADADTSNDIDCEIYDWEGQHHAEEEFGWDEDHVEAWESTCTTPPIFPAEHAGLQVTWNTPGEYIFRCTITCSPQHTWMNGHIVVE